MNLLLEQGLPEELNGVPLYTDFRNMIRFELAMQDDSLTEDEKLSVGLSQLFDALPSGGIQEALRGLEWFYLRGHVAEEAPGSGKIPERAFDFSEDAGRIYAAFLAAYGMNLVELEYLHWWAFLALLEALPETTQMGQIMAWRTMDVENIKDKGMRAHYSELKRRYSLQPGTRAVPKRSLAEQEQRIKDRVAKRFRQAKEKAALP